jgi:hypothetical protein
MNSFQKLRNFKISKIGSLKIKGGQEEKEEAAKPKASHSRPLTGFY